MHYACSAHARAVHTHAHARPPPRISSAHMQCMQYPRRAQDVFASDRLLRNYLLLATCYLLLATCYLLLATCHLPDVFASALLRIRCIAVVSPSGIRQSSKGCNTVRGEHGKGV